MYMCVYLKMPFQPKPFIKPPTHVFKLGPDWPVELRIGQVSSPSLPQKAVVKNSVNSGQNLGLTGLEPDFSNFYLDGRFFFPLTLWPCREFHTSATFQTTEKSKCNGECQAIHLEIVAWFMPWAHIIFFSTLLSFIEYGGKGGDPFFFAWIWDQFMA